MKKLILLLLALSTLVCSFATAFAANTPTVIQADRQIVFDNPESEYINDVYMVPVRQLCELANASVDWYGDKQMILINSKDNLTRLFLYLNKDTLRIFTFTAIADGAAEEVKLEAPLKIVDGRTLVPFNQILDALNTKYLWSDDSSTITVSSDEIITDDPKLTLSLSSDKEDVNAGDEVTISIVADNAEIYKEYGFTGYSAGIIYNKEEFTYVSSCLTNQDGTEVNALGATNDAYSADSTKIVYVTAEKKENSGNKVVVGKVVLKALTDNGGKVALSNRKDSIGYDTSLVLTKLDNTSIKGLDKGSELTINTTPIEIK